jgi:thiamine pyrophosphokinase
VSDKLACVVGDFDSVEASAPPSASLRIPSQESNDLFKALAVASAAQQAGSAAAAFRETLAEHLHLSEEEAASLDPGVVRQGLFAGGREMMVVVIGGMGGRFDHEAQSLNALECW